MSDSESSSFNTFESSPTMALAELERARLTLQFIAETPPGELLHILNDIKVIVDHDEALKKATLTSFDTYFTDHFHSVKLNPSSHPTLLTPYNKICEHIYHDSETGQKFIYDPFRQQAELLNESILLDLDQEDLRLLLQEKVRSYVSDYFDSGIANIYMKNSETHICITATKYDSSNYCNGKWIANWLYNPHRQYLDGKIKIFAHYFEDGNIQLVSSKSYHDGLPEEMSDLHRDKSLNRISDIIISKMTERSNQFQSELNNAFLDLSENTYKNYRKALPLTKEKMNWDKISGYSLAHALPKMKH